MNHKSKAVLWAVLTFISESFAHLFTLPNADQNALFENVLMFVPYNQRAYWAAGFHILTILGGAKFAHHCASSGPSTPPANNPNE